MARYIDADKLKRDLIDNRSFYPAIVKSAIENAPTEDVVPRSEVEGLQKQLDSLIDQYRAGAEYYAKTVARDIIREIRKAIFAHGTKYAMKELAKIEKEYIGEKNHG